jgi:hypothetical protein
MDQKVSSAFVSTGDRQACDMDSAQWRELLRGTLLQWRARTIFPF